MASLPLDESPIRIQNPCVGGENTFSDAEVDAILGRAAELAKERATAGSNHGSRGFSLDEVEKIASEAGIGADLVREAAVEVKNRPPKAGFLTGRVRFSEYVVVPGPVDSDTLHRLVMDLPDIAGTTGQGSVAGKSVVWRSDGVADLRMGRRTRIEIDGDATDAAWKGGDGRVFVRVSQDLSQAAGGIYGGIVGGLGIGIGMGVGFGVGLGAMSSASAALLIFASSIATSYGFARLVYSIFAAEASRRGRAIIKDLRDRLGRRELPPAG